MPGIILYYLRLIFKAKRDASDPEALAGWCLLHKKSFRVIGKRFGPLVVTVRIISNVLRKNGEGCRKLEQGTDGVAVWDNRDVASIRLDQIRFNGGVLPKYFIARNATSISPGARLVLFISGIILGPWLAVWSLFKSGGGNIGLWIDQWVEAASLIRYVRQFKIRYVYFYCPYESDCNALYLLLKREGVEVNKIPSPNLLAAHNQELLADILTLTSPYQLDETEHYKSTIKVRSISKWLPEQFAAYADTYQHSRQQPERSTIGYYSHASWIRSNMGDKGSELGDVEAEFQFIEALSVFLKKHPQFRCRIFLHPKEKKDINAAKQYYDAKFSEGKYEFSDLNRPGAQQFDSVDIGVGAISTILFERLFMGCKTIFYPVGISIFPLKSSAMNGVCPVSYDQLETLILQSADETTSDFFRRRGLNKYTINGWNPDLRYAEQN